MEYTEKKGNTGIIILVTMLILIIIGLGTYLIYDKVINKNDTEVKEPGSSIEKNDEDNSNKEVEVTDQLLINDIRSKIATVSSTVGMKNHITVCKDNKCEFWWLYFNNAVLEKELQTSDKTAIILVNLYIDKQFKYLTTKKEDTGLSKENYEQLENYNKDINDGLEINYETVNEISKQSFGIEASKDEAIKGFCPDFLYDSKSNKYFIGNSGCGGSGPATTMYYINKYTTKDDNLYAYVSVGGYTLDSNKSTTEYLILKDYYKYQFTDESILYKKPISEFKNDNGDITFSINEDNYKDFQEYVFEFKKDSTGNYYFVKTTKK